MKTKSSRTFSYLLIPLATMVSTSAAAAGISIYNEGDKYAKIGGRIQLQYHQVEPKDGEKTDSLFFRRFRPYIEGSVHKNWKGKFQWDMGKAEDDNEISIKDAYMQYKGFKPARITVGNANFPFSRELLTSSKKQGLVERTFVGDHNYGTPDRNTGIHINGDAFDKRFAWYVSAANAVVDPDSSKLDFDTPVNTREDFNQGWMLGGRIDIQPFGKLKYSQGDFKRDFKLAIGLSGFSWSNDDDNNTYTDATTGLDLDGGGSKVDVGRVTGAEIDLAVRGAGLSLDAQYNVFTAQATDDTVTTGLYKDGELEMKNYAVEGGYMVIPSRLELVLGYQGQDAETYEDPWIRKSAGLNYYFHKHDIKVQLSWRQNENKDGVLDADENELFLQSQYVF